MKPFLLLVLFYSITFASPLQDAINNAKPYSTIKLSSGVYKGNITINKPLTIIAKDKDVTIKGDGIGTVITINSSNVTLKNLHIQNSGKRIDKLDSAISIKKALHVEIDSCKITNSLYGIDMDMVSDSKISNNYIRSYDIEISLRGNALKLYYSHNNIFLNNTIEYCKDVTLNYSNNNTFKNNNFFHNRFATHLSISHKNNFFDNTYKYNSVSMMFMGAKDTNITNNTIQSSNGAAGIAVVIKGVSDFIFEYNKVQYNAKALYIDGKEKADGIKRHINYNDISYNSEALHFHASIAKNQITHNKIYGNISDVVKDIEGRFSKSNIVEYNYWDRYAGFDKDNNNIGDTTHKIYQYSDKLWHQNNDVKFFYGSPILSILDFIYAIAPFVEPNILLEDSKPIFK